MCPEGLFVHVLGVVHAALPHVGRAMVAAIVGHMVVAQPIISVTAPCVISLPNIPMPATSKHWFPGSGPKLRFLHYRTASRLLGWKLPNHLRAN